MATSFNTSNESQIHKVIVFISKDKSKATNLHSGYFLFFFFFLFILSFSEIPGRPVTKIKSELCQFLRIRHGEIKVRRLALGYQSTTL